MDVDDLIEAQDSPAAEFEVNPNIGKDTTETVKADGDGDVQKLTEVESVAAEGAQNIVETKEGEQIAEEQVKTEHEEEQANREDETVKVEGEHAEGEHAEGEHAEGEHAEGEHAEGERAEGEHAEGEHVEGEHAEGEHVEGEHVAGEHIEGEQAEGEHIEGEHAEGEHVEGEQVGGEHAKGEDVEEEHAEGEHAEGEETAKDEELMQPEQEQLGEEIHEEEDEYYEPPVDPAAPYDLTDSKEALRPPFHLRPDQEAELESLWELYQDYTPAYADLDNYITEKELIYMLKCLNCMTHTPEQLQELIVFCVRPPHPKGHIKFEQFKQIVKVRLRDISAEEELRFALQVMDPESTGILDREELKEVLATKGHKMGPKNIDNLIKEVDIAQDGTIGIEDVVGTMAIDLNTEDLEILRATVYPPDVMVGGDAADTEGNENQFD